MAIDRALLSERFSRDEIPAFVCPRCQKGLLSDIKHIEVEEPAYSKDEHSADDWEPDWITERFILMLRCNLKGCGELVTVTGKTSLEEVPSKGGWEYEAFLVPTFMYPAPAIIKLPEELPHEVKAELLLAFQIFWTDAGACATKIRTSVERLMDDYGVAKFKREKGKLVPLSLYKRIEKFIESTGKVLHQDHLHALRTIGNLGTHSNSLARTDLLEAFEVYEHLLDELINKKSAKIAKLAKKLKAK